MLKNKGFTLAEVLITLGIIGVVAALTMPSLMANYKKQRTIAQLKKTYTILQNGFREIMAENDCDDINCTGLYNNSDDENLKNLFEKKFKILKYCVNDVACHNAAVYKRDGQPSEYTLYLNAPSTFILTDGAYVSYYSDSIYTILNDCEGDKFCAMVMVDINGAQQPNVLGDDVFLYLLNNKGFLHAMGSEISNNIIKSVEPGSMHLIDEPDTECPSNGTSCGAKIISDGWDITYW